MISMPDDFLRFCWLNLPPYARAKILGNDPGTVWIFGAGASHHYDLNKFGVAVPLAGGFFEAFNWLPSSQELNTHVGPLISFLEHYRGVAPSAIPMFNENIEDFMTSVEAELEKLRAKRAKRNLTAEEFGRVFSFGTVFSNMNFIFANVLNEAQNGASASLYHQLLNFCGPNDTFMTFNWDTLLDRALADSGGWSPNEGYGFKFAASLDSNWKSKVQGSRQFKTNWKLMKLHGSTNWLVPHVGIHFQTVKFQSIVPNSERVFLYWHSNLAYSTHKGRWRGGYAPTCYGYYPPNIPGKYFDRAEISAPKGRVIVTFGLRIVSPFSELNEQGVPSSPVLITPVRQKKYGMYASTIGNVWKQAEDRFKMTNKIVFIGYSFPPTDIRPMKLLKSALNARKGEIELEIVAPGVTDIVSRIGEKILAKAKKFTAHNMKFEDYLAGLYDGIPELMKRAAAEDGNVRDWMLMLYALHQRSTKL
jgi:hypothetical protein